MKASKTIPIVVVNAADPVAVGVVESFARPGGNVTGCNKIDAELSGKRLGLFKESSRGFRVAVLMALGADGRRGIERVEGEGCPLKV